MSQHTKPIAQTNKFIVLDTYIKLEQLDTSYQSEADLERTLIADLVSQGYERISLSSNQAMLANVRVQLQILNEVEFTDIEWHRFVETYLDKPSEGIVDKTRKIHDDYIYDFVFDDGHIKNIYLLDKTHIVRNKVQVLSQFEQMGTHANRYDVTILVNGLPLVHIELKRRGVAIREAFNQIHRYSKESFNSDHSLFKFIQLFIISNGTDTRYFANTVQRNKNSYDFTMNWAKADNTHINDLKDFTATFLQKNTLLNVLLHYSVFDVSDTLLIMRAYQIAATERILRKINSSYAAKNWSNVESGGYIWHTTGTGKTLTSFKAARMACELDFIDKVFFVVDRKDLDYQTMKEYQRFSPDSVNGSDSTKGLKQNIAKHDNKIIVTTIQKLNNLMKSEPELSVYQEQVVFIFDECHRSQFGEAQKNLTKRFKRYYQFGFTGTPISSINALGSETTKSVFGIELHSYVITNAINDGKVLKFKVDYNDVRPQFKTLEMEQDEKKLSAAQHKQALLYPNRITEISQYILDNFRHKTHRLQGNTQGFNAMFAVSSVDAAKCYYETLNALQADSDKPLKIATIFSFAANEEQSAVGDIADESFEASALSSSAKEFLTAAINDYNTMFHTNYGVDSKEFQNYYRDLAKRVQSKEVDLLIVVGMFLTGFDAPTLNTLFVDKNLRFHGLIQAYSRTNRIYDATKTFGNVVTFRDLEQATIDAITLFGNTHTRNVVLEKSYEEYMNGSSDQDASDKNRGFVDIVAELERLFPAPENIHKEADKKAFVKLFGEYLKVENILQNYDEFVCLQALQNLDTSDDDKVQEFKTKYHLTDEVFDQMQSIKVPSERKIQDYRSTYNDIRDWLRNEKNANDNNDSKLDWDDVVFEVELLKSQEINLDFILEKLYEHSKQTNDKDAIIENIRRVIRASIDNRAKEGLFVDFINQIDFNALGDKSNIIEQFYSFARAQRTLEVTELIDSENLNSDEARRYITYSLENEHASEYGTELNAILPTMSPLNPEYLTKKQSVYQKILSFIDKYKRIGGEL